MSPYLVASTDLRKGLVAVDVRAATKTANLFGQIVDNWFKTIADIGPIGVDKGEGGKILLTPPGYADKIPDGYIKVKSPGFRVNFGIRAIPTPDGKPEDAVALGRQIQLYYLSEARNRASTKFIDPLDMRWSTLPRYDERWLKDLHDIIDVEPTRPRDKVMMGMLTTLGVEKGKPFKPDAKTLKAMSAGVADAYHYLQTRMDQVEPEECWCSDGQWRDALVRDAKRGFIWETDDMLDTVNRAVHPWVSAIYLPREMAKKPVTMYLITTTDKSGAKLAPGKIYAVTVRKDVPVSQFWSLTVYDCETWSFT